LKIIFGIGNPGLKYEFTRHNLGFIILDRLVKKNKLMYKPSKFDYYSAQSEINGEPFCLVKPTTYVNNSGLAARDVIERYSAEQEDFLVVSDDINLPAGKIRIRKSGGTGGHNGIESIIYHLKSDRFPRLRFGIGGEIEEGRIADYVLDKISDDEFESISESIEFSCELIENFIAGGTDQMLNVYAVSSQNSVQN